MALVVLGLVMLGLAQATRFGLAVLDRQERQQQRQASLDSVYRILKRLVENARPGSEWEPLLFIGGPHSLAFTSIVPLPADGMSLRRADVRLSVDATHHLLLGWTPHLHVRGTATPQPADTVPILGGIERIDVGYWPAGQGGGWTSTWRDPIPPRLVRFRIVLSDPRLPGWPEMVAAPRLDPP